MVFFIGHSAEIEGKVYLVPIEGELDNPGTLIPLESIYAQMAACKARQKILVLDINRYSPTNGVVRPGSGKMTEKTEVALKNPPAGVQVWSACSRDQESYETDDGMTMGAFVARICTVLAKRKAEGGYAETFQKREDPIELDKLNELVVAGLAKDLGKMKLTQTPFVAGKEKEGGTAYDPKEKMPDAVAIISPQTATGGQANVKLVKEVLAEIGTPPVKLSSDDGGIKYESLPPFSQRKMEEYVAAVDKDSDFQKAIAKARAALWAVYPNGEPTDLRDEVKALRDEIKATLTVMQDGYRKEANENNFKKKVQRDEEKVADMLIALDEAYKALKAVEKAREGQPKRWQVNYDFVLARLQRQIAYLYEYQSMLGSMRKEFPPMDPAVHTGWKLASRTDLQGDATGRKLAATSLKTLDRIASENAGTPWEVLAKREKLTALGLEWKAGRP
jgi:hypothetical protein